MPRKMVINRVVKLNWFTGDGVAYVRVSKSKIKSVPVWFNVYSTYPLPRLDMSARIKFKELIKAQILTSVYPKNPDDDEIISNAIFKNRNSEILDFTIETLDEPKQRNLRMILDIEKYLEKIVEAESFIKSDFTDEIENLNTEE